MATKIEIISQAMLLIGEEPVSDLESGTRATIVATNLYDVIYKNCLSMSDWNFATKRELLSRHATADIEEYEYTHQVPSDHVRIITINEGTDSDNYEIHGNLLHSNEKRVVLEYVHLVEEQRLPSWFHLYVVYELAKAFALPVTQNKGTLENMGSLSAQQLRDARFIDSTEAPLDGWNVVSDFGWSRGNGTPQRP